jgi:hypothetical protein
MEWLTPWHPIPDSEDFTLELIREVIKGHPLFQVPTKSIARRQDCDDVLFQIEDGSGRVAVVHLTWSMKPEPSPNSPHSVFYDSLQNWAREAMSHDHDEFA